MSLNQLNRLVSKHNLRLTKNDRKFYKKFNYRLGLYYFMSRHFSSNTATHKEEEYFKTLRDIRYFVDNNSMQMRCEQSKINLYSKDVNNIAKFMELYPFMDYHEASYWPEDISHKINLRKNEPEFPWEVKLGRNVNKDKLLNFWNTHKEEMWMNQDSKYELDLNLKNGRRGWGFNSPHTLRTTTFNSTIWRFKNIDTKNLFLFTFGEHLKDETLFKKE